MRTLYKFIFSNILGWNIKGDTDIPESTMVIVAPHTSFFDGFIGKLCLLIIGWKHVLLSAPWLFKSPMLPIMKLIGAIPVQGARSIYNVVKILKSNSGVKVVICPEGHLAPVKEWNLGFLYMAKKANVPIIAVTLNYKTKTITVKDVINTNMVNSYTNEDMIKKLHDIYGDTDTCAKYPQKFILP